MSVLLTPSPLMTFIELEDAVNDSVISYYEGSSSSGDGLFKTNDITTYNTTLYTNQSAEIPDFGAPPGGNPPPPHLQVTS